MSKPKRDNSFLARALAAALLLGCLTATETQAAYVIYQTGASGGGTQNFYATFNPISGVLTATMPKFNPLLGTLTQADFEFAASTTGTWISIAGPTGTSTINLSGPADVDGNSMGNLAIGFVGPYDNIFPTNDYDGDMVNLSLTSGAYFNTLTLPGTITMSWVFSGSSTLDTLAIGQGPGNEGFSWGGSVHVTYFYDPVPEPSALLLAAAGLVGLVLVARRRVKA